MLATVKIIKKRDQIRRRLNNGEKKNKTKTKTDSKEDTNEGTLGGFLYMMREETHLTLKEKKNGRTVLTPPPPPYETLVFTVKGKGQSRKRKRYVDI